MPPWTADPNYRHYANERLMEESEIQTIRRWVTQGKAAGDKKLMPRIPNYSENSLIDHKPDMVLKMDEPFKVRGINEELFAVYKFVVDLDEPKDLLSIEYVPGARQLVHHMNFEILKIGDDVDPSKGLKIKEMNQALDQNFTPEEIYTMFGLVGKQQPERIYYGGWVPGMSPQVFGGDIGIKLPKRFVVLVNNMHFTPTPIDEFDNSRFNIFFKDEPTRRTVQMVALGTGSQLSFVLPPLELPPGTVKKFHSKYETPGDASVMYLTAHMHLLGKKFRAWAIAPSGTEIPLIKIDKWDFYWQEMYEFNPMIKIPKGSVIHVEGVYDNTINNPNNPFSPPRLIGTTGGMSTTTEMLTLFMLILPYEEGDEVRKIKR